MPAIVYKTKFDYKNAGGAIPRYPAGTLLLEENGGHGGTVWVVDYTGKLRWFKTAESFVSLGFKWEDIIKVPQSILDAYDQKNARVITDTDPPILVGPATEPLSTKNIMFGVIAIVAIVAGVLIYKRMKKK